jgi:hypothetical protein
MADKSVSETTLGQLLSPPPGTERVQRVTGRFGYQMVADIISFAHNLPQRLLLIDQLERLPEIVRDMLLDEDVRQLLSDEVLRAMRVADTLDRDQRVSKERDLAAQLQWVKSATVEQCRNWCGHSADLLCEMAELALPNDPDGASTPPAGCVLKFRQQVERAGYPSHWFIVLETLLPHIERQIWLTDLSAPLPAHAIARMHDPWAALIMLWAYKHRERFLDPTPEDGIAAADLRGAFGTDILKFAVSPGWALDAHSAKAADGSASRHQVRIVVGPFLARQPGGPTKPHLRLVRQFREYLQLAAAVVPGWERSADSMPAMGEMMDA